MSVLVGELVGYPGPMSGGGVEYPGYQCWEYPGPCWEEGIGEGVGEVVGGRSRVFRSHVGSRVSRSHVCWVPCHVTYPMT